MKRVLMFLILMLLIGCATKPVAVLPGGTSSKGGLTSPASDKPIDKPKATVDIDPYLLEACKDFEPMLFKNPTPNDVLVQRASDVAIHKECAQRHRALSKIVKDAFNLK